MATEAVKRYLRETNRPYSANDITLNLHKEYGKTAVQKALDELAADGSIREKVYGKQKVYCVVQEQGNAAGADEELKELEKQVAEKSQAVASVESELRQSESVLRDLLASRTTQEAADENLRLAGENLRLGERLKTLTETTTAVSREEKEARTKRHMAAVKEYRKRKRICTDVLNAILEGYPKGKKHLFEEVGIETDEDAKMEPITLA